jgi:hypothetical protein
MNKPTQSEMELNMMTGKGQLGIQRIPSGAIPKQSPHGGETRTGNGKSNFDVKKKMTKVMKHVMKGC